MSLRIYFAGSIRGGRDDVQLYLKIIRLLQEHGTVLTEHVADPKLEAYGISMEWVVLVESFLLFQERSKFLMKRSTRETLNGSANLMVGLLPQPQTFGPQLFRLYLVVISVVMLDAYRVFLQCWWLR